MTQPLIQTVNVSKTYAKNTPLKKEKFIKYANKNINLDIYQGEVLGLVGESGSGKSTLGRLLLGLEEASQGQINYPLQKDIKSQVVFQNNYSSVNPHLSIRDIVAEPLLLNKSKEEARKEADYYLSQVGIPSDKFKSRPRSFSGGQLQRVNIARALANKPDFIVLDEPVSALDVSVQATVINLLMDLQKDFKLTYLFITHDLSIARVISDRIAVMKDGEIIEVQETEALFQSPQESYPRELIGAIPSLKL